MIVHRFNNDGDGCPGSAQSAVSYNDKTNCTYIKISNIVEIQYGNHIDPD